MSICHSQKMPDLMSTLSRLLWQDISSDLLITKFDTEEEDEGEDEAKLSLDARCQPLFDARNRKTDYLSVQL